MTRWALRLGVTAIVLSQVSVGNTVEPPKKMPLKTEAMIMLPAANQQGALRVTVGEARLVKLAEQATAIVLGNPDIASVQVRSGTLFLLLGMKPGRTTLFALGEDDRLIYSADLTVAQDLRAVQDALRRAVPDGRIQVTTIDNALLLTGSVQSSDDAIVAGRIAAQFTGDSNRVINRLQMTGPNQVQLRVRIAEVKRSALRTLGINWDVVARTTANSAIAIVTGNSNRLAMLPPSTGRDVVGSVMATGNARGINFNTVIDMLEQQGLATVLAQPSLSAVSGQQATFLAGGEIPVPVPVSSSAASFVALHYKSYGVSLSFTPTILAGGRISMRVNPEVSSLDPSTAVQYNGFNVPGIATRRADTSIELGSGESFVIAGLLSDTNSRDIIKVPGIGELPILGALFRSERFQRDETELLIVVTPFLAMPSVNAVPLPTDAYPGGTFAAPPMRSPSGPGFGTR